MKRYFTVPLVAAVLVVGLGATLLTVGARSPYTHAHLLPEFDPRYTRTEQILVGPATPIAGPRLASWPVAGTDPVESGQQLYVGFGCASCHGLDGRGGPVAPPIVGFNAADLRAKTSKGPGGMPVFSPRGLTDQELAAIAVYLKALAK